MQSVVVVSVHKCATSYFSHHLLPTVTSHQHVDPQTAWYLARRCINPTVLDGTVHGVIRLLDADHPLFHPTEAFLANAINHSCLWVVLVRDPRDVLVSMYYSFGVSHELSEAPALRAYQVRRRRRIGGMDIDGYVLAEAGLLAGKYARLMEFASSNRDAIVIKYEHIVEKFDRFRDQIESRMTIPPGVMSKMFKDTRPNDIEDITAHKRSGLVAGYKSKLEPATIVELDKVLANPLDFFSYDR